MTRWIVPRIVLPALAAATIGFLGAMDGLDRFRRSEVTNELVRS